MPLSFGKIGALIALLTITAFILWLLFTSFFASETVEEDGAALIVPAVLSLAA